MKISKSELLALEQLELALGLRRSIGALSTGVSFRLIHGPTEVNSNCFLKDYSVDVFWTNQETYFLWVTDWSNHPMDQSVADLQCLKSVTINDQKPEFCITVCRSPGQNPGEPKYVFGKALTQEPLVRDACGGVFISKLEQSFHPGLFLDHAPLRLWLKQKCQSKSVLNLFSYTGSLSVAAGLGGAQNVTSVDLSKSTTSWALQNWKQNGLSPSKAEFIAKDCFEFLEHATRKARKFDIVIADPPSFSRSQNGVFSTSKDLARLTSACLNVLAPKGFFIFSVNSEQLSRTQMLRDIQVGAQKAGRKLRLVKSIEQSEDFPWFLPNEALDQKNTAFKIDLARYLKGGIFWVE